MNMYQKRKARQEKEENNSSEKSFSKTSINWYPGHMAKTRKQIAEDLKLIDVVIEILDSRIPISSRNPDIANLTSGKDKIIILNKSDLADKKQNELWVQYFKEKGQPAILQQTACCSRCVCYCRLLYTCVVFENREQFKRYGS